MLFTAGAACLLLALCWWLIEMRGWRLWSRPFLWLGSNAIVAYALSTFAAKLGSIIKVADGITLQTWVYEHWFAPLAEEKNASLAFALSYTALWTLVAWALVPQEDFCEGLAAMAYTTVLNNYANAHKCIPDAGPSSAVSIYRIKLAFT